MSEAEVVAAATPPPEGDKSAGSPASLAEKSSYYYAHKQASGKTLVGAQTIYNHKPLNEQQKEEMLKRSGSPSIGESAWNTAGTWEEKDFSKWAKERMKDMLTQITTASGLSFHEVSSVDECHASVVLSRGKKRAIFEVEKAVVQWKMEGGGKGTLSVYEVSSNDLGDMHLKAKVEKAGSGDAKALEAELLGMREQVCAVVTALVEELRAK